MDGIRRGVVSGLVVGVAFASADASVAALAGFRVPLDVLGATFVLDLAAAGLATVVAAVVAWGLLGRGTQLLGPTLVCIHGALGLEMLLRLGFHRSQLTTPLAAIVLGGFALCGVAALVALRWMRRRPSWGMSRACAVLLVVELVIAGLPLVLEGRIPVLHRVQPFLGLGLAVAAAGMLQRPLLGSLRSSMALAPVGMLLVAAVGLLSVEPRPELPRAGGAGGLSGAGANSGTTASLPNILLISVDTLRDDVVGPGPDGTTLTPNLDRLAASGWRFSQATSPAAWTLPAHASLLTGRYPASHGVLFADARLPASQATIAEALLARGYRTLALTGGGYVSKRRGFDRGFEVFDDRAAYRYYFVHEPAVMRTLRKLPGRRIRDFLEIHGSFESAVDRAMAWIEDGADEPWFLFLHTYEVHNYCRQYGWWRDELVAQGFDPADYQDLASIRSPVAAAGLGDEAYRRFREMYSAGVALIDRQLGRLFDAVDGRRTAVFFTSDHGEGFDLARDRIYHGGRLHEDQVRVPMIVRVPGSGARQVDSEVVSLVDLAPTILQLAGAPSPSTQGRSLLDLERGESVRFGQEAYHWKGARRGKVPIRDPEEWLTYARTSTHKLIRSPDGWEYYDLVEDPHEGRDLLEHGVEADPHLLRLLQDFLARQRQQTPGGESSESSAVDEELLKKLGYIER